jgi:5-methyltetrahydrofolate--homocysteine methyltransferase
MADLKGISESIISGNSKKVAELTGIALQEGISPKDLLDKAFIPGMAVVGERFKSGECFVPEVLIAAKAMHAGMNLVKPLLAKSGSEYSGKVVIGTVRGDMHDIGKNLVSMMLEGAGFQIVDLGVDVPPAKFIDAVKTQKPDVLALSALLTTTMLAMKDVIAALDSEGIRCDVKVIIGGAPVTEKYAAQIGADGFAVDAPGAVDIAKKLIAAK